MAKESMIGKPIAQESLESERRKKPHHLDFSDYCLESYEPVTLTMPLAEVTEVEVENKILQIARKYGTYEAVKPRPVRPRDVIFVKIESESDAVPKRSCGEGVTVSLGSGSMPKEFDQAVLGMEIGERRQIVCPMIKADAHEVEAEDEGGQTEEVEMTVELLEIRRIVDPVLTDEWVKLHIPGVSSLDQWRRETEKTLVQHKRESICYQAPSVILSEIASRLAPEPSKEAIAAGKKTMMLEFKAFLDQQSLTQDDFCMRMGCSKQELERQLSFDAEEMVRNDIALSVYARDTGIEIGDEDEDAVFDQPTREATQKARDMAINEGRMDEIREIARRKKALNYLMRTALCVTYDGKAIPEYSGVLIGIADDEVARAAHTVSFASGCRED